MDRVDLSPNSIDGILYKCAKKIVYSKRNWLSKIVHKSKLEEETTEWFNRFHPLCGMDVGSFNFKLTLNNRILSTCQDAVQHVYDHTIDMTVAWRLGLLEEQINLFDEHFNSCPLTNNLAVIQRCISSSTEIPTTDQQPTEWEKKAYKKDYEKNILQLVKNVDLIQKNAHTTFRYSFWILIGDIKNYNYRENRAVQACKNIMRKQGDTSKSLDPYTPARVHEAIATAIQYTKEAIPFLEIVNNQLNSLNACASTFHANRMKFLTDLINIPSQAEQMKRANRNQNK